MYNVVEYGFRTHDLNITELYWITHIYYNSFLHNIDMHDNCECKKRFPNNKTGILYNYLLTHYEQISIVNNEYDKFLNANPNLNILIICSIKYKGMNDNLKITKPFYTVGYNNDIFYNIYIHPTFNNLNHNKYLIESIYDTYFIQRSSKNDERINGKLIKTVLFSCDTDKHYIFDWNNNGINYIMDNALYFNYRIRKYMRIKHISQIKNYHMIISFEYNELTVYQPIDKIKKLYEIFYDRDYKKRVVNGEIIEEIKLYIYVYILNYLRGVKIRISDANKKRLDTSEIITEYILNYDSFNIHMRDEISETIDEYLNWTYEHKQLYMSQYNRPDSSEETNKTHDNKQSNIDTTSNE